MKDGKEDEKPEKESQDKSKDGLLKEKDAKGGETRGVSRNGE